MKPVICRQVLLQLYHAHQCNKTTNNISTPNGCVFSLTDVPQVPHVPDGPVNKRQSKVSVRQKTKDYEEGKLNESVSYVQKGAMTTNFAAKHFGVPRTTLQYRLSTKCKHKGTTGPYPVFTTTEEQDIVSWLLTMERRGFPATYFALKYKISAFLAAHPRKTPFKDNVPGMYLL